MKTVNIAVAIPSWFRSLASTWGVGGNGEITNSRNPFVVQVFGFTENSRTAQQLTFDSRNPFVVQVFGF